MVGEGGDMTIGVRQNENINPGVHERKKVGTPGLEVFLYVKFKFLKVMVSRIRNVLNVITCDLSSNDGHPFWGAPCTKKSDHTTPGVTEPALRLNNVITFYLLLCPRIGNT
ncbi:hypothetical protein AVEN_113890-1 [Araneus ventricosus]|uniref:Uncharacterized protein n=1 Tax=Araneus ventricosus TaxID=182803 RepID=A0A4Y2S8Y7_ARAVE|nr:hypothetical protein AVEN_113890-1 [Araneus ventricosus]